MLDEPFSNLDARLRIELRDEIRSLQKQLGITTIFVTHDQEEAMSISDRILLLKEGVMQQYSTPKDMYTHPANRFTAGFLGNPPINFLTCRMVGGKLMVQDCGHGSMELPVKSACGSRPVCLRNRQTWRQVSGRRIFMWWPAGNTVILGGG